MRNCHRRCRLHPLLDDDDEALPCLFPLVCLCPLQEKKLEEGIADLHLAYQRGKGQLGIADDGRKKDITITIITTIMAPLGLPPLLPALHGKQQQGWIFRLPAIGLMLAIIFIHPALDRPRAIPLLPPHSPPPPSRRGTPT